MGKVLVIVAKEWEELRHDWVLILSTLAVPLLLSALAVGLLQLLTQVSAGLSNLAAMAEGAIKADPTLAGLSTAELEQALLGKQLSLLFLLLPLLVPTILAAYSIVGEKTSRTLEPVLASPVHTWQLLVGKSLVAWLPATLLTWVCGLIYGLGLHLTSLSERVTAAIVTLPWLLVLLLCAPLLALITVALAVLISSRVNDPRTAQQMSGMVVVPILVLIFSQLSGALILSVGLTLLTTLFLLPVLGLAGWVALRLFQRETILTRWR